MCLTPPGNTADMGFPRLQCFRAPPLGVMQPPAFFPPPFGPSPVLGPSMVGRPPETEKVKDVESREMDGRKKVWQ